MLDPIAKIRHNRGLAALAILTATLAAGCDIKMPSFFGGPAAQSDNGAPPTTAADQPDTPFTLRPSSSKSQSGGISPSAPSRTEIIMRIMLVQIPHSNGAEAEKIWNHLREDILDSDSQVRLRRNGVRVGVGRLDWWEPIQAALNAIDDTRSNPWEPLRLPPAYALGLELDSVAREQTIFCVQNDGILSGGTFTNSRNALSMTCLLDPRDRQRVHLHVVPEVRQQLAEMQWVKTESGFAEMPSYAGQRFDAAAIHMALDAGEFVVLAPSEEARLFGILGAAFLTEEVQNRRYDSYVFLRPELTNVAGK